jgi:Zn-dependent oligopeptidase
MFAKHHTTDETMPPQLLHDLRAARAQFSAMEMQTQVVYAMYDQVRPE